MQIHVNNQPIEVADDTTTVAALMEERQLSRDSVVVAVNGDILTREEWESRRLEPNDEIEIVQAVSGGDHRDDPLIIAGETFHSRLILGTGKYDSAETMNHALEASGTEMVTVAIRYMSLNGAGGSQSILEDLDLSRYRLLPNTAGAYTVEDAVKMARLARAATGTNWIKLEVIGDQTTLWPDVAATIEATKILVEDDFVVLPYTSPDLVAAIRLEEAGAATVMPLASPIGSGQGMQDWVSIQRIVEHVSVPVVVDAGIGVPSDAALSMELGAAAVLVNTAVAKAKNPARMAEAMKWGTIAGSIAWGAGRMERLAYASPSSPTAGVPLAGAERIE